MPEAPEPVDPAERGSMADGFLAAALCNLAAMVLVWSGAFHKAGPYVLWGFGIVQLVWIIPLWKRYEGKGKTQEANGVAIAAGVTFILSAGCWWTMKGFQ